MMELGPASRLLRSGVRILRRFSLLKQERETSVTTINDRIKAVHATARAKGWWDKGERNPLEILALVHSEISEASEYADPQQPKFPAVYQIHDGNQTVPVAMGSKDWQPRFKPEGVAVELMDAVIRIYDYFGFKGWDFDKITEYNLGDRFTQSDFHEYTMLEEMALLHHAISQAVEAARLDKPAIYQTQRQLAALDRALVNDDPYELGMVTPDKSDWDPAIEAQGLAIELVAVCLRISKIFKERRWDEEKVLTAKAEYNANRSYRHGGKVY